MFRSRKFIKMLQCKESQPNEQSDEYNMVNFKKFNTRMAYNSNRRQQEIYADFLKALNSEKTSRPETSSIPIIPVSQQGQTDFIEPNKIATLSAKTDHFKCIAESVERHNRTNSINKSLGNNNNSSKDTCANTDTFLIAARPILLMAQFCGGLLPVQGIRHSNPTQLRFSCKSLPMLLTFYYLICSSMVSLGQIKHLTMIDVDTKNIVGLAFFACVQLACVLFLVLAIRWPGLMITWSRTERIFTRSPYVQPKRKLAIRLRFAALVILSCSLAEHSLYLISAVLSYTRKQHLCAGGFTSFDDFMLTNYSYVFTLLPYHTVTAIFILLTNGACTFIWNYMDLFIMMVSKGIAYRFEQITMRINQLADKEVHESVFVEIREHYVHVCELLEEVDDHLSGIILLSNLNNLYFVCTQLLNIFNKLRWPINYIYFWYSLLYLIGRAAFVFLCAATINDESKGALSVLRRVSHKTWCIEVERLIFQMTTQTVALTGKKFYFLTRSLLFGMAGTIVTYELVLLQFDEPNRVKGLTDLCAP